MKRQIQRLVLLMLCCCTIAMASAQQRRVEGTVKDEQGNAVIGATVLIKGSTTGGTSTDEKMRMEHLVFLLTAPMLYS
jgi:hypothetical protein